ncbi:MAG TPA: lytic transglycosylase domain-containing protein [Steroidobacteraceae bacterium]|nr:lytic transglycosylase domain-containing protein [Steroidobacteraceae bacterium]HNS28301.1 lytic transglycosylase domain-containing protein [Steroidobacteraceae bacterium]
MARWISSARDSRRAEPRARRAGLAAATLAAWALASAAQSAPADGQQEEAGLRSVIERAIAQAECFPDEYESAVWFTMMEPRLVKRVPDKAERMEILRTVFCEAHRKGEVRLPPGLVMAVIDIESRFDRWAVSYAGAVGLMQIMPFWPEKLGMQRHQLTQIGPNIRMGCAILRYYLRYESNNIQKALARYNGSVGRRTYSDLVINSWSRWNGADDLGLSASVSAQPVSKPLGR